jgi:hypothetical protein
MEPTYQRQVLASRIGLTGPARPGQASARCMDT